MGKKIDLSVIIPVYQSEQYIAECLQSILCSEKNQYRVLCMDEVDRSKQTISEYCKK